jgi:hypothetical protein
MAYTPDYSEADISSSVIDIIVKIVLTVGLFATIIVLLFLYSFLKNRVTR